MVVSAWKIDVVRFELFVVIVVAGGRSGRHDTRAAERERAQREDLLRFQVSEIDAARLTTGEEEELRSERTRLANAERQRVWDLVRGHLERTDVQIERVDLEGYPPDALVAYVENVGAELLVVGTRGRGELASMVLGSTSHRAIHLAPCDVLVVKPQQVAG